MGLYYQKIYIKRNFQNRRNLSYRKRLAGSVSHVFAKKKGIPVVLVFWMDGYENDSPVGYFVKSYTTPEL